MFIATKTLPLDVIRIDGGTQSRTAINTELVDDYAQKMADGVEFPAGVAYFDGKEYWLADGFHRYHALKKAKKVSFACQVANGTVRDAILYSFGANGTHGMPMSQADKRHIVTTMLKDHEWGQWSDREIARRCHVSHPTVARIRAELAPEAKPRKAVNQKGKEFTVSPKEPKEPKEVAHDPKDLEIARLNEQIETLVEENDSLTMQLATGSADDPEFTTKTLEDLREENKQLRLEVKSLTISRDQFQAENAQLIKQVNYLTKKLKAAA